MSATTQPFQMLDGLGSPSADDLPADSEPPSARAPAATSAGSVIRVREIGGRASEALAGELGAIDARPLRARIEQILRATRVFRDDEVAVALELYDEATLGRRMQDAGALPSASSVLWCDEIQLPTAGSEYLFLGAFGPDDELVGYACYGATPGADRVFDLYWIAVDPARHGAGVGTILLDEVERRLRGLRARLLIVETSSRSDYAPTRAFYARRGYAETARVAEFYAPGDDRIIFSKRFHSPTGRERSRDE